MYLVADPIYQEHRTGRGHPESPFRYQSIMEALKPLKIKILPPREVEEEDILRCHTFQYLEVVKRDTARCAELDYDDGSAQLSTGDAQICSASYQVALKAVGGVLSAVDALMQDLAKSVFCIVRPPGHHACSDRGMGFCLFNNIAIGARYAQAKYGISRVLIVDWDVHHGNGTQEIFESDPSVFYFSTHQWPLYPGTGAEDETGTGSGKGSVLNCPIGAGIHSREDVLEAFREKLIPAMKVFKPELVMISAGFDAHRDDPLGGFNLTDEDFGVLTTIVREIAEEYAKGRIVSVLEGGYNLKAIASAAKVHVEALMC